MGDSMVIAVDGHGDAELGAIALHTRYLVHREPDGTLILVPVEVAEDIERSVLGEIRGVIDANRADPDRLKRRIRRPRQDSNP